MANSGDFLSKLIGYVIIGCFLFIVIGGIGAAYFEILIYVGEKIIALFGLDYLEPYVRITAGIIVFLSAMRFLGVFLWGSLSKVEQKNIMPSISVNKRNIAITILVLVPITILAIFVMYPLYMLGVGWEEEVATISLDNGYSIHLWEETAGMLDDRWDPDIGTRTFYEVKKSDIPIVSKSSLGPTLGYDYHIKFEFIPKGVLVCHKGNNHRDKITEFVVGIEEGKSWPHLIAAKTSFGPKIEADSDGRLKIGPLTSYCLMDYLEN